MRQASTRVDIVALVANVLRDFHERGGGSAGSRHAASRESKGVA